MCSILIVDDNSMVRQALELLLKDADGMNVIGQASNGLEAVELCHLLEPDIILMDYMMPVMNGMDAARLIHQQFPKVKIIFLTSMNHEEKFIMGLNESKDTYLSKNSQVHEISTLIRHNCANQ